MVRKFGQFQSFLISVLMQQPISLLHFSVIFAIQVLLMWAVTGMQLSFNGQHGLYDSFQVWQPFRFISCVKTHARIRQAETFSASLAVGGN